MNNKNRPWTVLQILKATTEHFSKKNIENPRLNAERLLAFILQADRIQLYVQFERILNSTEIESYRNLIQRRVENEPLQYILGETEFMGLKFKVTPKVLIPRPETEILVEKVLELKDSLNHTPVTILDIGTGSGCIATSIAHYWSESRLTATDISQESLAIASENAELNQVADKVDFIEHDILTADSFPVTGADIIVSNPPYIGASEMEQLRPEIKNFEPEIALTDNDDGTLFYEKILALIGKGFQCKFVFMELNASLADKIQQIVNQFEFTYSTVFTDLNSLPRVLKIEI